MSELERADLNRMAELANEDSRRFSGTAGLATMVVMSGHPSWLTRTKARYELSALARGNPDLARTMDEVATRFEALGRGVIAQWQSADTDADPALIDEQAFAVFHFIKGVILDFVRERDTTPSVERIDQMIQAILRGTRDHYERR